MAAVHNVAFRRHDDRVGEVGSVAVAGVAGERTERRLRRRDAITRRAITEPYHTLKRAGEPG